MSAPAEDIAGIQSTEYILINHIQRITSLQRNCTRGILYADTFSLYILSNFTADKNGYYWCQILINGSFTQPSQQAWFYAEENASSCTRQDPYFRAVPNSAQCASGKLLSNSLLHRMILYYCSSSNNTYFTGLSYYSFENNIYYFNKCPY